MSKWTLADGAVLVLIAVCGVARSEMRSINARWSL